MVGNYIVNDPISEMGFVVVLPHDLGSPYSYLSGSAFALLGKVSCPQTPKRQ